MSLSNWTKLSSTDNVDHGRNISHFVESRSFGVEVSEYCILIFQIHSSVIVRKGLTPFCRKFILFISVDSISFLTLLASTKVIVIESYLALWFLFVTIGSCRRRSDDCSSLPLSFVAVTNFRMLSFIQGHSLVC